MRGKRYWIAAALLVLASCGDDDTDTSQSEAPAAETTDVELGAPVESRVPPAVVPANATLDESLSQATFATYLMPSGVSEDDVLDWYGEHMPKGSDFEGLEWLEALPPSGSFGENWYWCAGPGKSIDVSFGQNDPDDGGRAFVGIALQDVSDGACGTPEDSSAPLGLVETTVFNMLTAQGATPEAANCAHRTLLASTPEAEVLALAGSDVPALLDLVAAAASECDVPPVVVQAMVEAGL